MKKAKKLYEGKAKIIFATDNKDFVIQHFKDDATAFNNQKRAKIEGKGVLNNRISEHILMNLDQVGIKNHLVKRLNMREQLIKHVEIIPIEFIVRNIATGSLTKRLGIEDGTILEDPLIEYCLKNDELGDPLVSKEHIYTFKWANKKEIEKIDKQLLRINDFMVGMFRGVGIKLVDFKVEFGRIKNNGKTDLQLAYEISQDTCRLWDYKTDKKLEKYRFTNNLGNLINAYQEVAKRLGILHEQSNIQAVNFEKPKAVKNKKQMKIKVIVTLKSGVLDPQGKAIQQTLNGMGFANVKDVRQGKYFDIDINENDQQKARFAAEEIFKKLLANQVIEDFKII